MKYRAIHFLLIWLSGVLLATGCSYSGRSGNITASSLVTKSDAERVLGVPVRPWIDTTSGQESTCSYVEAPNGSQICLQATFVVAESEQQVQATEEIAKRFEARDGTVETVEGIGDGAWLVKRKGTQVLHVRKKNIAFLLFLDAEKCGIKELANDEMKRLAKRVAEKL